MGERVNWIQHRGKKILFCTFTGLEETEYLAQVDEMENELEGQPSGSNVLMLIDVTNSRMTPATRDRGKQTVSVLEKAGVTTTTAMVGISGLQKIIASSISKDVHYGKDIESVKDWLVSQ
jgi:hypothetical protein